MPAFFLLFWSLISSLASFFAVWLSKKTAIALALITTYGVLTTAMVAAIASSIAIAKASAVGFGGLPADVVTGMSYFAPDNLSLCIGLCIAGRVQVTAYLWNIQNLRWIGSA